MISWYLTWAVIFVAISVAGLLIYKQALKDIEEEKEFKEKANNC